MSGADDIAISVEGLSKSYLIGHQGARGERYQTLRDTLARGVRDFGRKAMDMARGRQIVEGSEVEEFWALRDVSFEIRRGEVVGVIGRNGAGKSTLLKILSRITEPTQGRVRIRGRVASLLEVGTGFHPELTGRENIFLNGAVLGMSRAEIRRKFDEIVAFSEVEKFIDTPVKRYSSGMYVRLAFAVAAHLEPEILVVDEVLAVGDAEFQRKCLGKMSQVAGEGRTVLFVSHNMPSVQRLCSSGLVLSHGSVVARGTAADAIEHYTRTVEALAQQDLATRPDRRGAGGVRVVDVTLHDMAGAQIATAVCGQPLKVRIHYRSDFERASVPINVAFTITNQAGITITCLESASSGLSRSPLHREGYFECMIPKLALRFGLYTSTLFLSVNEVTQDWVREAFSFAVEDGDFHGTGRLVARQYGDLVFECGWSGHALRGSRPVSEGAPS